MTTIDWKDWRGHADRMGLFFAFALTVAILVSVILFAIALIARPYVNNPPIIATPLDAAHTEPLCPGDSFDFHTRIVVQERTFLFLYISVMDEKGMYNINGTQETLPPRPHPRASVFVQTLPWIVPDLEPGKYLRVLTLRDPDGEGDSVNSEVSFVVGGNCPREKTDDNRNSESNRYAAEN